MTLSRRPEAAAASQSAVDARRTYAENAVAGKLTKVVPRHPQPAPRPMLPWKRK